MCNCGDTYCKFCGPAQGNNYCQICGKWSEDGGCENPEHCKEVENKIAEKIEKMIACFDADEGKQTY